MQLTWPLGKEAGTPCVYVFWGVFLLLLSLFLPPLVVLLCKKNIGQSFSQSEGCKRAYLRFSASGLRIPQIPESLPSPQPAAQSLSTPSPPLPPSPFLPPSPSPSAMGTSVWLQDLTCANTCPHASVVIPGSFQRETRFAWNLPKSREPLGTSSQSSSLGSRFLTLSEHLSLPSCPNSHQGRHRAQTGVSHGWDPSLRSQSFFCQSKSLHQFHWKCLFLPCPTDLPLPWTPHCFLVQLHSSFFVFCFVVFNATDSSLKSPAMLCT